MSKYMKAGTKVIGAVMLISFVSGCASVVAPIHLAETNSVPTFDQSQPHYGARIALAEASFTTRVDGLSADFAR